MDPDDMTVKECLERAEQVHNNGRINESPLYWTGKAIEKLEAVEERLAEVEDDERLGYDDAEVQVNAPLALIQTSLKAKRDSMRFALDP